MESEWDLESYDGEDYWEEWDDSEAFPFFGRRSASRSPGALVARRVVPPGARGAPGPLARRPAPLVGGAASPAAMTQRVRQLDAQQRATALQLASLRRTAAYQSSDQFGPMLTGAVGALALGIKSSDPFSPAVVAGLPLAQLLLQSRGRALTAGFNANPWSTLAFPAAAALLVAFRDSIPGIRARVVAAPEVSVNAGPNDTLLVTARSAGGATLHMEGPSASPGEPSEKSNLFLGFVQLKKGDVVKLRAFIGSLGSETVTIPFAQTA